MGTHEQDKNMRPDSEFINGDLAFLVEGNCCRLLDGRRTTGYIEKYCHESAMFRWRITKYEDTGKYWEMPAETIKSFQFEKDAKRLPEKDITLIKKKIEQFEEKIYIKADENEIIKTEDKIRLKEKIIIQWLKEKSSFFQSDGQFDMTSNQGSDLLIKDLKQYMKSVGLLKVEEKTAGALVLNPSSGEWIKGMEIVLGEMGLISYAGKVPRTKDIFSGLGSRDIRCEYLINRLAFIRAYFKLLEITEVVLYRGMCTEGGWKETSRSFLSCTFNLSIAKEFSNFDRESRYKHSYLIKVTCPVNKIFMTYLETEELNKQYKEAEALILCDQPMII